MAAPTSSGQVSLSGGTSTALALVQRLSRRIGDNPYTDTHSSTPNASATSLTVASDATTRWEAGDTVDWLDDGSFEASLVTATAATTLTIVRGHRGTTAASHLANAVIRKNPLFLSQTLSEFITEAVQSLWPDIPHVKQATYATPASPADLIYALPTDVEQVYEAYQETTPTGGVREKRALTYSVPSWWESTYVTTKKAIRIPYLDTSITDVTNFYLIYGAQHTATDLNARLQDIVIYEAAANALEAVETRQKGREDDSVFDSTNKIQLWRANARRLRSAERARLQHYLPRQDTIVWRPRVTFTA